MSENETLVNEVEAEGLAKLSDLAKEPTLTPEDRDRMQKAFNYWHTHGYPEKASVLWECLEQDRRPPSNLIPSDNDIKPETAIDPKYLEIPAYAGPKATKDIWQDFAKKTLDMDHMVIETLERKDLIELLQSKGVIPREDPRATNQHTKNRD